MKQNEFTRHLPKKEEIKLTYYSPINGAPLYVVTKHIVNGTYKLYGVAAGEYKFLKSRKNDPLFQEVIQ